MSWQAIEKVKVIGTDNGPELFRSLFKRNEEDVNAKDSCGRPKRGQGFAAKKTVLLFLAAAHRPGHPLRISYDTIATASGSSIATVHRAADWLDKKGIVLHEPHHDKRGRRASNTFYINFDGAPRDVFAAQVLKRVATATPAPPTSQNDLKDEGHLEANLTRPTSQYEGDQCLVTVPSTVRERGRALSLSDDRRQETLLPGWALPKEEREWTLSNVPGATDELITKSAAVFFEHHADTPRTHRERSQQWRKWARREHLFQQQKADRRRQQSPSKASGPVAPRLIINALQLWKQGTLAWDHDNLGPEPNSHAEADERIEALRVSEWRATSPQTPPQVSGARTDTSCA